jgi:hypothetical protein
MSVFTFLLGIFMAGLVSMTQGTLRVTNTADSSDEARRAFLRLDRQVRYADAINYPGQGTDGAWYVEFRTPLSDLTGPTARCSQWRYRPDGTFQTRSWAEGSAPAATSWSTVMTSFTAGTTSPFVLHPATGTQVRQRLEVELDASRGRASTRGSADLDTSFVARNSTANSPGNVDTALPTGVSDNPVCGAPGAIRN